MTASALGLLLRLTQTPAPTPTEIPPLPPIEILPPWMVLPPPVIVLISLGFFAACTIVLFPLVRALSQRLAGRGADEVLRGEVAQLQERVRELEQTQHRMLELEDRLDFAERLLAERRSPQQMPRG